MKATLNVNEQGDLEEQTINGSEYLNEQLFLWHNINRHHILTPSLYMKIPYILYILTILILLVTIISNLTPTFAKVLTDGEKVNLVKDHTCVHLALFYFFFVLLQVKDLDQTFLL